MANMGPAFSSWVSGLQSGGQPLIKEFLRAWEGVPN